MSLNVQSYVRECGERELAAEVAADVTYVRNKTGIDVGKATIQSTEKMGDAAGTCVIETKEMEFRADNFLPSNPAANNARFFQERRYKTGSFRHVARHEAEHAIGNRLEGTTELVASKELGVDPVPAYRQKVRAASAMVDILGWDETMETARKKNAEVLLTMALVLKLVQRATDPKTALQKAQKLVKEAA